MIKEELEEIEDVLDANIVVVWTCLDILVDFVNQIYLIWNFIK